MHCSIVSKNGPDCHDNEFILASAVRFDPFFDTPQNFYLAHSYYPSPTLQRLSLEDTRIFSIVRKRVEQVSVRNVQVVVYIVCVSSNLTAVTGLGSVAEWSKALCTQTHLSSLFCSRRNKTGEYEGKTLR